VGLGWQKGNNMKKKLSFIAIMVVSLLFAACGNDDGDSVTTNDSSLNGTSWTYTSNNGEHSQKEFTDKDNEHFLTETLQKCSALKYTVGEKTAEEATKEYDLCDLAGHGTHEFTSMDFSGAQCLFTDNSTRYIQSVTTKTTKQVYTFTEGDYIGYDAGAYRSFKVYSYGIYMSTTGGDVVVLPLEGNYQYTVTKITHTSKIDYKTENATSGTLIYERSGDNITFKGSGFDITGTFGSDATTLYLTEKQPQAKTIVLQKK